MKRPRKVLSITVIASTSLERIDDVIYFDNSATTQIDPKVLESMIPFLSTNYGNPSSIHRLGQEAAEAVDQARKLVGRSLGVSGREIIFTSSGTEADNLAILGYALANRDKGDHVITSAIEHPAVLNTCHHLESLGFQLSVLPVDRQGIVDIEVLRKVMRPTTILVSIMYANNEIGTVQDIPSLAQVAHDGGAMFHTDAVQAVTKLPIDRDRDGWDLLSISGHKFHGPKGVGALATRKGLKLSPQLFGGGHERGLRSSTENVPGIVGMTKALQLSLDSMTDDCNKMRALRDLIIEEVMQASKPPLLNGHPSQRLCNNVNLSYPGIEGESLVLRLSEKGIATSTGSACSNLHVGSSHVLRAIGLSAREAKGSLRISLSRLNQEDEVKYLLEVLPDILTDLHAKTQ